MTQYRSFAQFNSISLTGRIFNAEIVDGRNGEFLAVTLTTNLKDDDKGVTVTFNTSNGLLSLYKGGYLPNGRIVTVSGNLSEVSETYEKDGVTNLRQRPQMHLVQVVTHVGPMPADKAAKPSRKGVAVVRPSKARRFEPTPAVAAEIEADEMLAEAALA